MSLVLWGSKKTMELNFSSFTGVIQVKDLSVLTFKSNQFSAVVQDDSRAGFFKVTCLETKNEVSVTQAGIEIQLSHILKTGEIL